MKTTIEIIERREAPTPHNAGSYRALVRVVYTCEPGDFGTDHVKFGITRDGVLRDEFRTLKKARETFDARKYP